MNRLPTTDLYFRDACIGSIARWWRGGPIRTLGANSFQCGDTFILIRRDTEALMHRALHWPHRLIYLIDDDIAGAAASPGLPEDYRRRLATFHRDFHRPLTERADQLIVSSAALRALFVGHPSVTKLDPHWSLPLGDMKHFRRTGPLELAHLGTGSHAAGLALLEPPLLRLLDSGRDLRFTFIAWPGEYPVLDAHPLARRIRPQSWPRYRRWLVQQRFHLGLYPLADTPFDRARSANKLIEYGITGAIGVYPTGWIPAQQIKSGAILAPNAPEDWYDLLLAAIDEPKLLEEKALIACENLRQINDPDMQRSIWCALLAL